MSKVNIQSAGAAPLSTGELQLANGVAMSTTLTAVTDQNNTASQLKLASNLTQVAGTLQIQTDTATYIDVEDGSGNNRFTVSRQPASQQVSVDFASVPTDLTTVVGAIRTATNGSTLANVVSFTEAGLVGFGTDTPGSKIDVHSSGNTVAQFNRTGTGNSQIQHLMTGTARWTTGYVNATGNYSIYDNVNAVFRTNLSNTGKLTIGNGDTALAGQLSVKGSGSTSATTSLLVQNSAGTASLQVTDDGNVSVGNNLNLSASKQISWGTGNSGGSANRIYLFDGGIPAARTGLGITNSNLVFFSYAGNGFQFIEGGDTSVAGNLIVTLQTSRMLLSSGTNISWGASNNPVNKILFYDGGSSSTRYGLSATSGDLKIFTYTGSNISFGSGLDGSTLNTSNAALNIFSSNSLGIGQSTDISSSLVTISSTTRGFLPPRMTTAQKNAIASPAAGLMVYDTTLNKLCVYTTAWEIITSI